MWFVLLVVVLVVILFYFRKRQKYWQTRGIASTSLNSLFGDFRDWVWGKRTMACIVEDVYKQFPNERCVGFYEVFMLSNLLVRDPRLIEHVLVKDFSVFTDRMWLSSSGDDRHHHRMTKHLFAMRGQKWKNLRSKLITTFSTNKLKPMLSSMERCAQPMDLLIKEKCAEEAVDVREIVSRFATDVIGCCVFGLQFNTLTEPESEYRKIGKKLLTPTIKGLTISILRFIIPRVISLLRLVEVPRDVEDFFSDLLRQSEDFRKKESFRRNDLMQLMLDIRDRDRAKSKECGDEEVVDDDVVLSNVFLFYLAGFETTASTLGFCLYELSLNPEYQHKLREEIGSILESNENIASYEVLKKMTYAEMVISETLRKYPPVGFLSRVCSTSYQLPDTSLQLAPGDKITIPVSPLHYDEKYYPDPDKFNPERFTPENIAARPPFTYMPFGDGPRMCLAVRFAKMEMKICLAKIISKYEFSPCSKTEIPLQMQTRSFLLTPKNGIQLQVRPLAAVCN